MAVGWLYLNHKELTAWRRIAEVEQYAVPVAALPIPEKARTVGLGEASHGCTEFQALKLTMLQRLVEEYGFRAFALELDFGEGLLVDEYIQGGDGRENRRAPELLDLPHETDRCAD